MKYTFLIWSLLTTFAASCQSITISGKVINEDRNPVINATIKIKSSGKTTMADINGFFSLSDFKLTDTLIITAVGYETTTEVYNGQPLITIVLKRKITDLGEVIVNTGYQYIPKERSTGSFEKLDKELLNRSVSNDWLSRLEGVSSVFFDNRDQVADKISIRGRSTIFANASPLIVLDNFPYEGTIDNINPNDIESITILKDAAAASIWGARAGNGVIVITTKKGTGKRSPVLEFNINMTIGKKPDAFYKPVISSSSFIDVESYLFNRGFYNSEIASNTTRPPLSPVVEILARRRAGQITAADSMQLIDALRTVDYRNDLDKYVYQTSVAQQYALSWSGSEEKISYYLSAGYDKMGSSVIRNNQDRITVSSTLSFTPAKFITVGFSALLSETNVEANGTENIVVGGTKSGIYPYARLADEQGNPLPTVKDYRYSFIDTAGGGRLLDWKYRHLQEIAEADNTRKQSNKRIGLTVKTKITKWLNADLMYQYENENFYRRDHNSQNTYFTRNLINRFYNAAATNKYPVPLGGILSQAYSSLTAHAARAQLNANHTWNAMHQLTAIAGFEIRQSHTTANSYRVYGYNDDVLTFTNVNFVDNFPIYASLASAQRIPNQSSFSEGDLRFVSVYTNAAYTFSKKHTATISARKDASNIFGVNTNQKWLPLWSAGYSWYLSRENFYKISWLPELKFRITYGLNGNVDNSLSSYTTVSYLTNLMFTTLPYARIRNHTNPELRWEKTAMLNLAIDFASAGNRITGSIEYYHKKGTDLIASAPVDPTTGVQDASSRFAFRGNAASIKGNGIDLSLNSVNIKGAFTWQSSLILQYIKTKVTDYTLTALTAASFLNSGLSVNPIPGRPLYTIYSYKWAGLDPATGDPQGWLNGNISKDYVALTGITLNDLVYNGSAVPELFGSFRNTFTYRNFSLSANIIYKLSYFFKRTSINYTSLYNNWNGHPDFEYRWQKPGDENFTNVPSMVYPLPSPSRDAFYSASEILVEKGGNIRLQDIAFSYEFSRKQGKWPVKNLQLYTYINNIGCIWKANKSGLDPDYFLSGYPSPLTIAFGIKTTL